jgi:hypothetical protein
MRGFLYFSLGVIWAAAACGQAIVEHSVVTSGASAAAAGAKGTGNSIGGVFRRLGGTLDKAGASKENANRAGAAKQDANTPAANAVAAPSGQSRPSAKPVPASQSIDPSQITEGLDGAELIQRFGEPVLRFSEKRNSQLVERLWYNTAASDQFEVRLIDGKVASVRPPAGKKQPDQPRN